MLWLTVAGSRLARTVSYWEPVRFATLAMRATLATGIGAQRFGFQRVAEDPLGARE